MSESNHDNKFNLLKDFDGDVYFTLPDLCQLQLERKQRNENFFTTLDHTHSGKEKHSSLNMAATKIQKVVRGHLGRKKYLDLLYESVLESENQLHQQQDTQVKEGEILIESYKMEQELKDTDSVSRNKTRLAHANASIIQRAWRASRKVKHEHVCCACNDYFPDLYQYYSETNIVCFCCDIHRLLTDKERLDLFLDTDYEPIETLSVSGVEWSAIDSILNGEADDTSCNLDASQNLAALKHNPKTNNLEDTPQLDICDSENDHTRTELNINHWKICQEKYELLEVNKDKRDFITKISLEELKVLKKEMEKSVSDKNLELLKELMIRDDLFTKHESLLYQAEVLLKNEQQRRK